MDNIAELSRALEKHIISLANFTSTPGEGVTRFPFTKPALDCVEYLKKAMTAAGLSVRMDGSGALIGRLEGKRSKTIMVGSHYDSVQHGGAYDGIAGVVCGLVLAEYLHENRIIPEYSLEIVGMNDEEGARFKNGFFSSKAMLGEMTEKELYEAVDADGISTAEAMKEWGLTPDDYMKAKRDISELRAFLEVHIEQGLVLESAHNDIGIVGTIVGMERYVVNIGGRADHAGTTPMNMRKDALSAAAKIISEISGYAREEQDSVATVGYISAAPNEINTIAQSAEFTLDIRSVDVDRIQRILDRCKKRIEAVCAEEGVEYSMTNTLSVMPTEMSGEIRSLIAESCRRRGFSFLEMNSGAGHDSLPIGKVIPTAMMFIPTKDGRSHCPEEYCKCDDLAKAVVILADILSAIK